MKIPSRSLAYILSSCLFFTSSAWGLDLTVNSPDFPENGLIPAEFTCDGSNKTPRLSWFGVPEATKSFAIIVDDPDAPSRVWVHWIVYNLPGDLHTLDYSFTGLPKGAALGFTDSRKTDYSGPCPPSGEHHYHFKLYALDAMLDPPPNPTKEQLVFSMKGHILAQGTLIGRYGRK